MKKRIRRALVLAALLAVPLTLLGSKDASAGVSVGIHIGLPPAFVFYAPPSVVAIPGTQVYWVPDMRADILFYGGSWYRPYEGRWYRAHSYNGPWARLASRHVPHALGKLPKHYRSISRDHHRIPYAQVKNHWRRWDRERHWDNGRDRRDGWKGHEKREVLKRGHDRNGRGHDRGGR